MAYLEQQDFISLGGGGGGGRPSLPGAYRGREERERTRSHPYRRPERASWPPPPSPARRVPTAGHPWLDQGKLYSAGVLGLHEEIEDFYQYMSPLPEEQQMRTCVFNTIRDIILDVWPHAQVFVFGSFETGLYLPTSDIDVVVIGKWHSSPLEMLKVALLTAGVCHPDSVKVIAKAAVPIVKLTDRRTSVKVDISFNTSNGLVSANRIKQYRAEYPHLAKLVLVLKQFLLQRELNEVFTGGVSSYSLILMTVSFFQTHERPLATFPGCNLGVLLLEFFELYGIKFSYHTTCIRVKERGYAPRSEVDHQFAAQSIHNSPLCIEDPHNSTNDIGRSSYNMERVQQAFRHAYHRLNAFVLATGAAADPNQTSLLGRVVCVPDSVVQHRRWVVTQFPAAESESWPAADSDDSGGECESGLSGRGRRLPPSSAQYRHRGRTGEGSVWRGGRGHPRPGNVSGPPT